MRYLFFSYLFYYFLRIHFFTLYIYIYIYIQWNIYLICSLLLSFFLQSKGEELCIYSLVFDRIYDQCMCINVPTFLGIEQSFQFPQLQKWLGLAAGGTVEFGHIVDPPVIRTATSILPLEWSGVPANKNSDPLKVDIIGQGLHLCTLVQAQVNGNWCSTVVESLPSIPPDTSNHYVQSDLQKMRILIGSPLKQPPKYPALGHPILSSEETDFVHSNLDFDVGALVGENRTCPEDLNSFVIYCTSDFITVSKKVHVRTRRVRLLGFEGAGKTSLFKAIVDQGREKNKINCESVIPEVDTQEMVVGGVCYLDSTGVNLQELQLESVRFREELLAGVSDLCKKTDLIVLVHNLSQKIARNHQSHQLNTSQAQPALSILLNEARALSIPWVLAITNKFSVSAHQQKMLVDYAMEAYEASPSMTQVINSCPFVLPSAASSPQSQSSTDENLSWKEAAIRMIQTPLSLASMPFQKKATIFPVQGIGAFRQLVHRVLRSHEEIAFQELANERLSIELAKVKERASNMRHDSQEKGNSTTAAAVGASLGAGLGIILAVVMGAASALRKP